MQIHSLVLFLALLATAAVQASSSEVHIHLRMHHKQESTPATTTTQPAQDIGGSADFDADTYGNDSSVDFDKWMVGNESFDLSWTEAGSDDGKYIGPWGQCGGNDYDGPTECITGWLCAVVSDEYSLCQLQIVIDMSELFNFTFSDPAVFDALDIQVPTVLVTTESSNQTVDNSSATPGVMNDAPSDPDLTPTVSLSPEDLGSWGQDSGSGEGQANDAPSDPNLTLSPPLSPEDSGSDKFIKVLLPIAGPWLQCGGKSMNLSGFGVGELPCANGYQCTEINEWYWQCVLVHEDNKVNFWGQCGGNNYAGLTECANGSTCIGYNKWYSQCVPDQV